MVNSVKILKEQIGLNQYRLGIKQLKFVQNYFDNGGNASKAALNAGYSEMHGRRLIQNATILTAIEEIKKKNGLTEESLLQKHVQLINAKKMQGSQIVNDNNVQLGALKLAYEINGKLIKKLEQIEKKLSPEEKAELIADLRKLAILK